jgi:taurine dioxygenase
MHDVQIHPLTPTVGAEIRGVNLANGQTDATMHEIEQALLDWKVIFFRDQDITTDDHLRFGRWFGDLEIHPFAPKKEGFPEVLVIQHDQDSRGQENLWHSDVTWREIPSLGSILRALEVPSVGGDTLFSDMNAAYNGLDDETKERIEGQVAIHDFANFRRGLKKRGASEEDIRAFNERFPNPEHPVVRTHPATGLKSIYVNGAFTQCIKGFPEGESQKILRKLYAQARVPEYQCRFRWAKNSIAFWDNRAVQHYAVSDYFPEKRVVERVTVCGDRPR